MVIALIELLRPARAVTAVPPGRWLGNLLLYVTTSLCVLPAFTVYLAAEATHGGLLANLSLPPPLHLVCGVVALDLLNYALHRLYHNVRGLWRLHAVHHSDPGLDITTTLRHHPLEALLNATAFAGVALVIGITPTEVLVYGWLAWAVQFPAHANIELPPRLAAMLQRILVTPAFHQVHHSRLQPETDSNYGEVFAFWDTLFRSARHRGAAPIVYGLDSFRDARSQSLPRLLAQPLLRMTPPDEHPMAMPR